MLGFRAQEELRSEQPLIMRNGILSVMPMPKPCGRLIHSTSAFFCHLRIMIMIPICTKPALFIKEGTIQGVCDLELR